MPNQYISDSNDLLHMNNMEPQPMPDRGINQQTTGMLIASGVVSNLQSDTELDYEIDDNFSYAGYQVVRREFFAHISEPSISFSNFKVGVNTAALNKLPDVNYVQMLINEETKRLVLLPCSEYDRDGIQWCITGAKRKTRQVTCKDLFALLFSMMDWNPDYRYKLLGKLMRANGVFILVFDLTATEVYQRIFVEGKKPKTSRVAIYPAEWEGKFGVPYEEHRKTFAFNTFNGYRVLTVQDPKKKSASSQKSTPAFNEIPASPDMGRTPVPVMRNEGRLY